MGLAWEAPDFSMRNRDHKKPEFLKLNPNGKVPVLVDGDTVLWESVAINGYLAEKYAPAMLGATLEDRAHVAKWGLWSQIEYQKPLIAIFIQKVFVPAEHQDEAVIAKSIEAAGPLNALLDAHLADRSFMVGDTFTLADIHVASVARLNALVDLSLEGLPHLDAWLRAMLDRPAQQKIAALREI
jgi:glutathione S-transferase